MDWIEELLAQAVRAASIGELEALSISTVALSVPILTDEVASSLRRFPCLRAVVHNGNSALTDLGVEHLAAIQTLEWLDLEWSTAISDASLQSLARLAALRWIDLSFCGRLTPAAIDALAKALPHCEIER